MSSKLKPGIDYIAITTPFYCNDGNGTFVFHKRSKFCRDEQGRWDFGSGQLEFGEDPREGVLREVLEEYGCEGEIQEQLPAHSILREHNGIKTHWLAVPFFIKVDLNKIKKNDSEKIEAVDFFTLDDLPTPLHTGAAFTMEHFGKHFAKYRSKRSLNIKEGQFFAAFVPKKK